MNLVGEGLRYEMLEIPEKLAWILGFMILLLLTPNLLSGHKNTPA